MVEVAPINWPAVLADLCAGRLSTYAVAAMIGVPRGTLRRWIDGSLPNHDDGERVIAVWVKVTGKQREALPTERRSFSAYRAR